MGITIHFQRKINPKIRVKEFFILAKLIASENKWECTEMKETPQKGQIFEITAHENCEPLIFRITPEGYFSDHCKTQFAPPEVHKGIVSLFDQVKIKLSELIVKDEGGFWESRDEKILNQAVMDCYEAMEKEKEADSDYYGPIKTEEGRIIDLVK